MTIEGFVREVGPDDNWATRQSTLKGYRVVIVDEFARSSRGTDWVRLAKPRLCVWTVGPGHTRCRRAAVVGLDRGQNRAGKRRPFVHGYCEQHLYGRRWESGRLLSPILVPEDEQP